MPSNALPSDRLGLGNHGLGQTTGGRTSRTTVGRDCCHHSGEVEAEMKERREIRVHELGIMEGTDPAAQIETEVLPKLRLVITFLSSKTLTSA